jgi:hypothetical protein
MAGADGVSLSLNASVNLANSPHYDDTNDLGICAMIWTEDVPGKAQDWYFILPNLVVKVGLVTYDGVIVRLSHGARDTWDSSCVRHCTEIIRNGKKKIFGFNATNKLGTISSYERDCTG